MRQYVQLKKKPFCWQTCSKSSMHCHKNRAHWILLNKQGQAWVLFTCLRYLKSIYCQKQSNYIKYEHSFPPWISFDIKVCESSWNKGLTEWIITMQLTLHNTLRNMHARAHELYSNVPLNVFDINIDPQKGLHMGFFKLKYHHYTAQWNEWDVFHTSANNHKIQITWCVP